MKLAGEPREMLLSQSATRKPIGLNLLPWRLRFYRNGHGCLGMFSNKFRFFLLHRIEPLDYANDS